MSTTNFTVGQLARITDTKAVTIRYYEQIGLLPTASRNSSGYRQYSYEERDRLLFIRRSRALGFSLDDVRQLLGFSDHRQASCAAVDAKVKVLPGHGGVLSSVVFWIENPIKCGRGLAPESSGSVKGI